MYSAARVSGKYIRGGGVEDSQISRIYVNEVAFKDQAIFASKRHTVKRLMYTAVIVFVEEVEPMKTL